MVLGKAEGDCDRGKYCFVGSDTSIHTVSNGSHPRCEHWRHAPQNSFHVHLTSQPSAVLEQNSWQSLCLAVVVVGSEGTQVVGCTDHVASYANHLRAEHSAHSLQCDQSHLMLQSRVMLRSWQNSRQRFGAGVVGARAEEK